MIKYKGIEFPTVDALIEYQEKAEGLKVPSKQILGGLTITPGMFENPPPFYPRQADPWIHKGPDFTTLPWRGPLQPTCESINCQGDGILDSVITNMHCR